MPRKPTIVVLPDAHAHPDYDNLRFQDVNRFLRKVRPEYVVCLGDFADMPSLNSHSAKLSLERQRYAADVAAAHGANEYLFHKLDRKRTKTIMCMGNHEERINTLVAQQPQLQGAISTDDLRYDHYWDAVIPYKEAVRVQGWLFAHYFPSGVMGNPVGGKNAANAVLASTHASAVWGHSHERKDAEQPVHGGSTITGINAGCLTHPEYVESWCHNTVGMWWRGVVVIEGADAGSYSRLSFVRMEDL